MNFYPSRVDQLETEIEKIHERLCALEKTIAAITERLVDISKYESELIHEKQKTKIEEKAEFDKNLEPIIDEWRQKVAESYQNGFQAARDRLNDNEGHPMGMCGWD